MTSSMYCPFCQRHLEPECDEDILAETGEEWFVYVHDDVPHDEDYNFEELQ